MDDYLPSLEEQAAHHGWEAGRYRFFDESDKVFYFNPTIVDRKDGRLLITRRLDLTDCQDDAWGDNRLSVFKGPNSKMPQLTNVTDLKFKSHMDGQQDEDPRAFQYKDQTFLSACSYFYYGPGYGWSGAHQLMGVFNKKWQCLHDAYPLIGGNAHSVHQTVERNEKNWIWFMDKGNLCLVYSCNLPWQVIKFGADWGSYDIFNHRGLEWAYGTIRGGTNPVKVNGLYWSFFHSSSSWIKFARRYFMGAVAFESMPPYNPVRMTLEPLISASDRNQTRNGKPLVVFPCGSIFEKDRWLITMGINDCYSAWLDMPHKDVYNRTQRL